MKNFPSLAAAQAYADAHPGAIVRINFNGSTWDGYEPADPLPVAGLAPRRAARWSEIKALRDRLSEEGGYKVAVAGVDKWFHSDGKSKTQQVGLVLAGASVPAVQWKTMDGSFVTMSQALASQIFAAAMAQDSAIFAAAEAHRTAMEAAADPDAYSFATGWPAVFGT